MHLPSSHNEREIVSILLSSGSERIYLGTVFGKKLVRLHPVCHHASDPWEKVKNHRRFSFILRDLLFSIPRGIYKLGDDMTCPENQDKRESILPERMCRVPLLHFPGKFHCKSYTVSTRM